MLAVLSNQITDVLHFDVKYLCTIWWLVIFRKKQNHKKYESRHLSCFVTVTATPQSRQTFASYISSAHVASKYVMRCAICYPFHNFKNVKNTHGGVLLLVVKLQANFSKSNTPPWTFFKFFKLYKRYQIAQLITYLFRRRFPLQYVILENNSMAKF